jgi:hypothetical protein
LIFARKLGIQVNHISTRVSASLVKIRPHVQNTTATFSKVDNSPFRGVAPLVAERQMLPRPKAGLSAGAPASPLIMMIEDLPR